MTFFINQRSTWEWPICVFFPNLYFLTFLHDNFVLRNSYKNVLKDSHQTNLKFSNVTIIILHVYHPNFVFLNNVLWEWKSRNTRIYIWESLLQSQHQIKKMKWNEISEKNEMIWIDVIKLFLFLFCELSSICKEQCIV